ncbi:leucine-rich repeat domain-containing protein [Flavobacterium sp.]|uniref:leucine-rich repeat domain-containing protein n=1 Tax=Flavobacterium sp. TaxID=239 RepID=UPI00260C1B57|nr:T9SS type A sorting domain-containing protein [Flavobacterium sp.]
MKKFVLLLVCFSFNFGVSQIINIPDPTFKSLLVNSSTSINTAFDCVNYNNYKIDINNNGEIEESEALLVCTLFINTPGIYDLTGIEFFSNLTYLGCFNNNVTNLDLSQLINLEQLWCGQNNLTNLDVSQNINLHLLVCTNNNLTNINVSQLTQLTGLNINQNQLTSLDVSNLPNLTNLSCRNNQISSLNFANNPLLEKVFCSNNLVSDLNFSNNPLFNELDCQNNPNLRTIKINNGTTQLFGPQTLYSQCWTGCPNLNYICADSNEMSALQNFLDNCGVDTFEITFDSNCSLGNEEFVKNELVVYPNPFKNSFKISLKNFTSDNVIFKVYDMLGKTIEVLDLSSQQLENLELGKNYKSGVYSILVQQGDTIQTLRIIKE